MVSLFSGAMGLDIGLERAGFRSLVAVEKDVLARQTIHANRPEIVLFDDVTEVTGEEIRTKSSLGNDELDLLAGGPPCQSFSVFGNRDGVIDKRGQLVYDYVRLVSELRPKVFVMENVRGLLSIPVIPRKKLEGPITEEQRHLTEPGSLLRMLLKDFEALGYRVDCFVVNSVNYGAPQIRERIICIGNRGNLVAQFPQPLYSNRPEDNLPPFRTLGDAIGEGFEDPMPEVMNFSERKLKYLAMVPEGGNWRSLPVEIQKESMGKAWYLKGGRSAYWRKLSFSFPSPTVVTMPNHAGTSMCHPTELRAISVGEAAAIQEFPHEWVFCGKTSDKFKQIGNAVPTRLGEIAGQVAQSLLEQMDEQEPTGEPIPSRIEHIRPHVRTRTFWKKGKAFAGDVSYYEEEDEDEERIESNQPSLFDKVVNR